MSSNWLKLTLGELCAQQGGAIQTGPFGSQLHNSDYKVDGTPVVMPTNIIGSRVAEDGIARIDKADVDRLSQHKLRVGDLVFSRRGDVTKNALVRAREVGWLCGTGCLKVRLGDESLASAEFVSYYLQLPAIKEWLIQHAVGATMPNLNTGILSAVPLILAPPGMQIKIVRLLAALDSSILTLQQQNTSLEAVVQTLFRSWFVNFDPVDAKAAGKEPEAMSAELAALFPNEFEDHELGAIPKGWSIGRIGDIGQNIRELGKPTEIPPTTPYIGLEHMPRRSLSIIEWGSAATVESGKFWFKPSDLLFGKLRPYFHKVGIANVKGVCSTDILVIRPKEDNWHAFMVMHLFSKAFIEHATQLSDGARMPRTNWSDTAAYKLALPPVVLAGRFNKLVQPMFSLMMVNVEKIRLLASLRDHLLPRLISGKLRIEDAEVSVAAMTLELEVAA